MKRERDNYYHHLQPPPTDPSATAGGSTSDNTTTATGKSKTWGLEEEQDNTMDKHLADVGYKVKSSDMAEVAQKLEQLEEVMVNAQEDGLSHLASDTIHYNPSDLSTWVETMLSELNPPPLPHHFDPFVPPLPKDPPLPQTHSHTHTLLYQEPSSSEYDLKAIPGKAVLESPSSQYGDNNTNKRARPSSNDPNPVPAVHGEPSTGHVVLVDSQENGVRLVHALMACAEAVQQNNLHLAEALVKQVGYLAISQAGAMRKVATYFAEALARRIYRVQPHNILDNTLNEILQVHFYETCPYLKFAHFTANQAILEAFEGKNQVHVIDFSMNQGLQWPPLMQALALRPGGPPTFRLTGIGPPSPDNSDRLQEVGWQLAQFAQTISVKFEYRGFVATSLADLDASMFMLRPSEGECVAVNSIFELHKLLARPGACDKVLTVIKEVKPVIVTVVEQEANHNGPVFTDRFTKSLYYYSTLFDSLEGWVDSEDKAMSEVYLGKQICNLVACEGVDRVERHETLTQWRYRLGSAGLAPVHLGSNAFKQASMLLALFAGGDGYKVEEKDGCLMLGWHTQPLITTSAWRLGGN